MFARNVSYRAFCTTSKLSKKVTPHNLKGKSVSSQQWLRRQLTDPFIEKAKMLNYRCRSAFKLLEMNERFGLLKPGDIVIDCGASPGSWTQVAVKEVNSDGLQLGVPKGKVIAIDKQQIHPIDGAVILGNSDFTLQSTRDQVLEILNGRRVDAVLSDMAPNATGVRDMDNENMINLCFIALRFALEISRTGAYILVKLWQCSETSKLQDNMCRFYNSVKIVKPSASRKDSAEIYLLARDFKGLKQ